MSNSKPVLQFIIAGTTIVLMSEVLCYIVKKLNPLPSSKKNSSIKIPKEVKSKSKDMKTLPLSFQSKQFFQDEKEALRKFEERKPPPLWNTVIFFPDLKPNETDPVINKLIQYFESAKISIQLCIFLVSHPALALIIRKKYREGLLVQVVTDHDTFTAHNSWGVKLWIQSGIEVRMKATGYLMHHKFAIIDEEALLTGSLNWTKQGVTTNQENVLITTNKGIVQKYLKEFYYLWTTFAENPSGYQYH